MSWSELFPRRKGWFPFSYTQPHHNKLDHLERWVKEELWNLWISTPWMNIYTFTSLYCLETKYDSSWFTDNQRNQCLSFLVFFHSIFFPPPPVTFLLAPSSCLRLTAPVRASWTSWCLRRPSLLSQRRSTHFLPRGSAPSVLARTAWPTATRSETSSQPPLSPVEEVDGG